MTQYPVLLVGWLPALAVVAMELSRRRRAARYGYDPSVSPEVVRWLQYGVGAYQLGYAALAIAWLDGRQAQPLPGLLAVAATCATVGLLWWWVGVRYGADAPRLRDLRQLAYGTRAAVLRRRWQLTRCGAAGLLDARLCRLDDESAAALVDRFDHHLLALQTALTTAALCRRASDPAAAREDVARLLDTHCRLVDDSELFLARTAVYVPVGLGLPQAVPCALPVAIER